MIQCKVCFKFRYEINEYGECVKCSVAADKRRDVVLHVRKHGRYGMSPFLSNHKIMSKESWLSLRAMIDRFYNGMSMDDIDDHNRSVDSSRESAVKASKCNDRGVIYLLRSNVGYFKIGKSINLDRRVGQHLRDYPVSLDVIHVIHVMRMTKCETHLLSLFADKRLQGEWFELSPDDVTWICSLGTFELESLVDDE